MNTNSLENAHGATTQPGRITRRTFVKRTGTTAVVAALALDAFRSEAKASGNQGSYHIILWDVTPAANYGIGGGKQFGKIESISTTPVQARLKTWMYGAEDYWGLCWQGPGNPSGPATRSQWNIKFLGHAEKYIIDPNTAAQTTSDLCDVYEELRVYQENGILKVAVAGENPSGGANGKIILGVSMEGSHDNSTATLTIKVKSSYTNTGSLVGCGFNVIGPGNVGGGVTMQFQGSCPTPCELEIVISLKIGYGGI